MNSSIELLLMRKADLWMFAMFYVFNEQILSISLYNNNDKKSSPSEFYSEMQHIPGVGCSHPLVGSPTGGPTNEFGQEMR